MNRYDKKRQEKLQNSMTNEYTVTFTKQELICIFNALAFDDDGQPRRYRLGDGAIMLPILKRLQPLAAIETNIPQEQQGKQPPPEELKKEETVEPAIIGTDADGEDTTVN
jgi:hypothetical protein